MLFVPYYATNTTTATSFYYSESTTTAAFYTNLPLSFDRPSRLREEIDEFFESVEALRKEAFRSSRRFAREARPELTPRLAPKGWTRSGQNPPFLVHRLRCPERLERA